MEINAITLECDSAVNKPRTLFRFTKERELDAHKNSHLTILGEACEEEKWGPVDNFLVQNG